MLATLTRRISMATLIAVAAISAACSAGAPSRDEVMDDLCSHLRDGIEADDVRGLAADLRDDAGAFSSLGDQDVARSLEAAADELASGLRGVTLSLEQDADIQEVRAELVDFDEIFDARLVEETPGPPSILLQVRSDDLEVFVTEMTSIEGVAQVSTGEIDVEAVLARRLAEVAASCEPPVFPRP